MQEFELDESLMENKDKVKEEKHVLCLLRKNHG